MSTLCSGLLRYSTCRSLATIYLRSAFTRETRVGNSHWRFCGISSHVARTQLFCAIVFGCSVIQAIPAEAVHVIVAKTEMNPQNGHVYHLLRGVRSLGITWAEGEAGANVLGGHLVAINDEAEFEWLADNFSGGQASNSLIDNFMWIGLNDFESEGDFVWSNGDPVTFTNWYPGEPNNSFGDEDYVHIYNYAGETHLWNDLLETRTFNDRGFDYSFSAIAEVILVPEPQSLAMLTFCLLFSRSCYGRESKRVDRR